MKKKQKRLIYILPMLFLFFTAAAQSPDSTECSASFSYLVNSATPLVVEFNDSSSGEITGWDWDFGDGTADIGQNPIHIYQASGTYDVTLTITGEDCASSYSTSLVVFGCTDCPDIYDPVCVLLPFGQVTLDNSCIAECLGFTDYFDCFGDSTVCYASFVYTVDTDNSLTFQFTDFSSGNITSWSWDFGDGTTSTEQNPIHTYAESGNYYVLLTIEGEDCSQTSALTVTATDCNCPAIWDPVCVDVEGYIVTFTNSCFAECEGFTEFVDCSDPVQDECQAYFYYSMSDANSLTVNFNDGSWSEMEITSWNWDFGDGITSTEQNPIHTYIEEGTYQVTLSIVSDSCENSYEEPVWVGDTDDWYPENCYAFFWFEQSEDDPMTLNFTDYSYGEPVSWEWNFGDGGTSYEQNPSHTFTADGYYQVALTVTTEDCTNSYSMLVWVNQDISYPDPDEDCIALFIPFINPFPIVQGDTTFNSYTVFFFNLSNAAGDMTSVWDFGDGTTSTDYFPVHAFLTEGTYIVTLTITTEDCTSTFTTTLYLSDGEGFQGNSTSMALLLSTNELETVEKAVITPNPVNDKMTLQFTSKESIDYNLIITSASGKEYINSRYIANTGNNTRTIQLNGVPSGLYFAQIRMAKKVKTLKFIVK